MYINYNYRRISFGISRSRLKFRHTLWVIIGDKRYRNTNTMSPNTLSNLPRIGSAIHQLKFFVTLVVS